MTHLSRVELNTQSLAVLRDIADTHEMHRTVMSAFPDVDSEAARMELGVLYRLEVERTNALLIVQSNLAPNWAALPGGYAKQSDFKAIDSVLDSLKSGQKFRFRLSANPTRIAGGRSGSGRGKRIAIRGRDEQIDWLERKGRGAGFRVEATEVSGGALRGSRARGRSRSKSPISIDIVRFDGILEVAEAGSFVESVRAGIGRGKAYGCGLVSLAAV